MFRKECDAMRCARMHERSAPLRIVPSVTIQLYNDYNQFDLHTQEGCDLHTQEGCDLHYQCKDGVTVAEDCDSCRHVSGRN